MVYKINYPEGVVRFSRNKGKAIVEAKTLADAVQATAKMFPLMREVMARTRDEGMVEVRFKVAIEYKNHLVREIENALRLIRDRECYDSARFVHRFILATIAKKTGQPEWLTFDDFNAELKSLRQSAVTARELYNPSQFVDYEIVTHNYMELHPPKPYKSRVVRVPKKPAKERSSRQEVG